MAGKSIADLGLLQRSSTAAGLGLAAFELLVASLLLVLPQVGAVVAAATLVIFSGLIARALREGKPVVCFCFGDSTQELSVKSLIRTITLAACALLATTGAPSIVELSTDTLLAGTSAVAILAVIVLASSAPQLLVLNSDLFAIGAPKEERR